MTNQSVLNYNGHIYINFVTSHSFKAKDVTFSTTFTKVKSNMKSEILCLTFLYQCYGMYLSVNSLLYIFNNIYKHIRSLFYMNIIHLYLFKSARSSLVLRR